MNMFNRKKYVLHFYIPAVYVLSQYGADAADKFSLSSNVTRIEENSYSCKP